MSGRRTFLGNAAAAAVITKILSLKSFGFATEGQETINPTKSDRDKAGLRGPVKTCIEETNGPRDDRKYSTTTEYSPDGRLLTTRHTGSDGTEWTKTQSYDADGRLTKTSWGKVGDESLYAYDGTGRLLSITSRPENSGRIDFQYDEQGRKTSIQSFDTETLERAQKTAYMGSLWDAAVAWGVGVPVGGNIITIYNDKDLPTEAQLRDSQGRIVTRIVRTYDLNGRISEENQIQENPALMFVATSGIEGQPQPTAAQLEAMNKAMKQMMGGRNGTGTSYAYDDQGRITEIHERNFAFDKVTKTSYNEHGDKSAQVETMANNSTAPAGVAFSMREDGTIVQSDPAAKPTEFPVEMFDGHKVQYAYQYDSYGNWTQQTVNHSYKQGEASSICHRTLTYY
jgi:YD repeat-containing protein